MMVKAGKKFESIAPEDIRADKITVDYLVLQQLNRINFLLTIGFSNVGENKTSDNATVGILFGLRSIESMLSYELAEDKEYQEKSGKLKEKLSYSLDPVNGIDCALTKWYDLLVQKLGSTLLPTKKETFHFSKEGWADDE